MLRIFVEQYKTTQKPNEAIMEEKHEESTEYGSEPSIHLQSLGCQNIRRQMVDMKELYLHDNSIYPTKIFWRRFAIPRVMYENPNRIY